MAAKARSKSSRLCTSRTWSCTRNACATTCMYCNRGGLFGSVGLARTAIRDTVGTASLRNSSCFPLSSAVMVLNPVMFPPRMPQAGDQPGRNRINAHQHHDRDRARGVLGGEGRAGSPWHHHVDLELDQLSRQLAETCFTALCPALLKDDVLALDVAQVAQTLAESLQRWHGCRGSGASIEQPDPVHFPRWLCVSDKRRREDTEGEGDNDPDGAAPHDRLLGSASCRPSSFHGSLDARRQPRREAGAPRRAGGWIPPRLAQPPASGPDTGHTLGSGY